MSRVPVLGSQTLPAPLTRFFGRGAETAALEGLVADTRLLTLTGAPGCGKTRLSIELGARLAPRFPDGVSLAELAPISDPAQVPTAVGLALGIDEEAGRPMEDTLTEALAPAELLLVLDNCEHVVAAAAELAGRLVAACPEVRVLATSRVALGVPGERVWRVPPLDGEPAVALFEDRAALAAGAVRDDDGALVERICRRLDGLPLAIELAAAWTRVLSPGDILARLDAALPLLTTEARTASPRQATMEATVDWSHRLLRPAEQRLFERLSVFSGGFDLRAAEAVAGSDDVLGRLTALVDHSLVLTDAAPERPMRYRLLEPVRQCGDALLAARDEAEAIRRRHAEHYLDVALEADLELRGDRRALGLRRLEQEEGNLLLALEWARAQRSPDLGLRLCAALARFWELRGRVNHGRARLEEMLARSTPDRRLRATALSRAGRLAWRQRDHERARVLLEESLTILRELGDETGIARRLRSLALVAMSEGDAATAMRLCEQSIDIFRAHGDEQGLVWALIYLGWARYIGGDLDGGDRQMRDALAANGAAGSVAATVNALLGLCYGATRTPGVADQRAHLTEALTVMRESGGVVEEPDWLWAASALAADEGRLESAFRLAGAAEALGRRGGTHLNEQFIRPLEQQLGPAGRRLGPARAEHLKAEGARMTLQALLAEAVVQPDDDPLSPREREVVDLVAQGLTNVEIGQRLFISKRTVETHLEHIKEKLGHRTRHEVMAWALRERGNP